MNNNLLKISSLCDYLPDKDKVYAKKFIEKRDFESLLEIVDSDLIKLRRNSDLYQNDRLRYETLEQKYEELTGELVDYINIINPDYSFYNEDLDEDESMYEYDD